MAEALSTQEATKRWEFLVGIENLKPKKAITSPPISFRFQNRVQGGRKRNLSTFLSSSSSKKTGYSLESDSASDPFDCSSMAVLPIHDIVENTVHQYLEEWKNLEDRKITSKPTASKVSQGVGNETEVNENEKSSTAARSATDSSGTKASRNTNHGGGWKLMEDRLYLPDGFDYLGKAVDDSLLEKERPIHHGSQDLVISLKNPTEKLFYHNELSKLFDSIPTSRELEKEKRRGHKVDNTLRVYQETQKPAKTTPDSNVLARLRVPDRHGLPQSISSSSPWSISSSEKRRNQSSNSQSATILLEFWRSQPKRGISSHRMVLEFLASQTLWDVHVVLSDMVEDELWASTYSDQDLENDSNASSDNKPMTKCDDGKETQQNLSGCFFIENTFYKAGSVDYAKPIIDWIDRSVSNHSNSIRRGYLGVDPSSSINHVKTMKTTRLSEIAFRPNIRYYHACHGDVETTVMLVDRKMICQKRDSSERGRDAYPLIHDIWTTPYCNAVPICEACQIYQSSFKANHKTIGGGPRSLCQECCEDLNLLKKKDAVKSYKQWRDQANLSNRIAHHHTNA